MNRMLGEAIGGGLAGAIVLPLLVFVLVLAARLLGGAPDVSEIAMWPLSGIGAAIGSVVGGLRYKFRSAG